MSFLEWERSIVVKWGVIGESEMMFRAKGIIDSALEEATCPQLLQAHGLFGSGLIGEICRKLCSKDYCWIHWLVLAR